jgi:hypothetical protein
MGSNGSYRDQTPWVCPQFTQQTLRFVEQEGLIAFLRFPPIGKLEGMPMRFLSDSNPESGDPWGQRQWATRTHNRSRSAIHMDIKR